MREIVLDTETTGLWINAGARIIELACIELEDHLPTGRMFHRYINPLIGQMPKEAFEIHNIPIEFLWHHAPFAKIIPEFKDFIRNDQLVIHNKSFDFAFINHEMTQAGVMEITNECVDTLSMARKMFPNGGNSLDMLCKRFGIDLTKRTYHGALIDCQLLAAVYLELIGGRQPLFTLPIARRGDAGAAAAIRVHRPPRTHPPISDAERVNFEGVLARIKNPIWTFEQAARIARPLDDEIPF